MNMEVPFDVQTRPLSEIRPYPHNPRINKNAVLAVAASIREFGWRQPIVVDEEGVIVVGHTRYLAAIELGLDQVPVHVAKGLTPAQIQAYRIADNKTAGLSYWDEDLLVRELTELQKTEVDLSLTGFSGDDLLRLLDADPTSGQVDPDDVPIIMGTPQQMINSWISRPIY
jgi:ParB-like chromosome segregation protein Spo0J